MDGGDPGLLALFIVFFIVAVGVGLLDNGAIGVGFLLSVEFSDGEADELAAAYMALLLVWMIYPLLMWIMLWLARWRALRQGASRPGEQLARDSARVVQ